MPKRAGSFGLRRRRKNGEDRPTSAERGYDWAWAKYAKWFLRQPENALCRDCLRKDLSTPSTQCDHIEPVSGPDDPLFWVPENHQGLCASCHSVKTNTTDVGRGRARRRRRGKR